MNNTEKLLRAFIEASGFEIKTKITNRELHNPHNSNVEIITSTDYKVTKSKLKPYEHIKCKRCGTHLAYNSPLDACLCGNSNNLIRLRDE